jgi:hypothetical protein
VAKVEYRKRVISMFPAWEEEVTKDKIACNRFFLAWVGLEAYRKKTKKCDHVRRRSVEQGEAKQENIRLH